MSIASDTEDLFLDGPVPAPLKLDFREPTIKPADYEIYRISDCDERARQMIALNRTCRQYLFSCAGSYGPEVAACGADKQQQSLEETTDDEKPDIVYTTLRGRQVKQPNYNFTSYDKLKTKTVDLCVSPSIKSEVDTDKEYKKRVIPPSAITKRGSKRVQEYELISVTPTGKSQSPTTTKKFKSSGVACPLCSQMFPIKDIEKHAATCGDTAELQIQTNIITFNSPDKQEPDQGVGDQGNAAVCAICDTHFWNLPSYEEHVRDCIARHSK